MTNIAMKRATLNAIYQEDAMTTKERIYAEIERIDEQQLDELYTIIKRWAQYESAERELSFMEKLRQITIDAPADFAMNLDLYTSGVKREDADIH